MFRGAMKQGGGGKYGKAQKSQSSIHMQMSIYYFALLLFWNII